MLAERRAPDNRWRIMEGRIVYGSSQPRKRKGSRTVSRKAHGSDAGKKPLPFRAALVRHF